MNQKSKVNIPLKIILVDFINRILKHLSSLVRFSAYPVFFTLITVSLWLTYIILKGRESFLFQKIMRQNVFIVDTKKPQKVRSTVYY